MTPLTPTDPAAFSVPPAKAHLTPATGPDGGPALTFAFDNGCQNVFIQGHPPGDPSWDTAAGFSFWVKGDGSDHLGGIEFIWNNDYGQRYGYAFPINSTGWKKVEVPWHDLIPEPGAVTKAIDPKTGNAPSKLGPITFGKWWYWKDYAAHSYTLAGLRLEPTMALDARTYRPAGAPLARVRAKLMAGKPITVVTMGDSLTDTAHWSNRDTNWPAQFAALAKEKHGAAVTIVNPAIGGTDLRQNLILLPRWTSTTPAPDLVTVFFGFNDMTEGMKPDAFRAAQQDAVDRARRATHGHADVLLLTPCPPVNASQAAALGDFAAAVRAAAQSRSAGLCDIYRAVAAESDADKVKLHAWDGVHLALPGQQLVAQRVLAAIESVGR